MGLVFVSSVHALLLADTPAETSHVDTPLQKLIEAQQRFQGEILKATSRGLEIRSKGTPEFEGLSLLLMPT